MRKQKPKYIVVKNGSWMRIPDPTGTGFSTGKDQLRLKYLAGLHAQKMKHGAELTRLTHRQMIRARKQAVIIIHAELERAADQELELRWEPIRTALTILKRGPMPTSTKGN